MPDINQKYKKIFSRRLLLVSLAQISVITAITAKLFHLQVNEREKYQTLSEKNTFALRLKAPERGEILDKNNNLIAKNYKQINVTIIPENTPSIDKTLIALNSLYPMADEKIKNIKKKIKASSKFKPVTIIKNINEKQYNTIIVNYHKIPGINIVEVPNRTYPYAEKLAHISGYVGKPSPSDLKNDAYNRHLKKYSNFTVGKEGIEKSYNVQLRGTPDIERLEVNAKGKVLNSQVYKKGDSGYDIQLTIDAELQSFVYSTIKKYKAASAVIIDTQNGNILAMANTPTYDCNQFITGISTKQWESLVKDELSPLTNRACQNAYPPGSTFKPIVALAALRAGIHKYTTHECTGKIEIGKYSFRCWKKEGHGKLNLTGAIRESCDIWFYNAADKLGIENITREARLFGLETAYDIPLAGITKGLVGDHKWKQKTFNEKWYLGDTLVASIGQGYMLNSPLQLAMMTAKIASGNINLNPRIINSPEIITPKKYDLPQNLEIIKEALWQVVNHKNGGTAYRSRIINNNFQMAGKTGTSQVKKITEEDREKIENNTFSLPWKLKDHALFVAFAPYRQPRYAVSIIVEHGGSGSKTAAPIAKKILAQIAKNEKNIK